LHYKIPSLFWKYLLFPKVIWGLNLACSHPSLKLLQNVTEVETISKLDTECS